MLKVSNALCALMLWLTLQMNDVLSLGQHRVWKRMAVSWSGAAPGSRVIDVCCGSGDLTFRAAGAAGPSGEVRPLSIAAKLCTLQGLALSRARLFHVFVHFC